MAFNAFGSFTTSSPISAISHNPCHDLASNCIRDYFGPTVQTVFDYLLSKSGGCVNDIASGFVGNNTTSPAQHSTLLQIISKIRSECKRNVNSERVRLVKNLPPLSVGRNRVKVNMARGGEEQGYIVEASAIRAALIVLLQHSIVKAVPPSSNARDDPEKIQKDKNMLKHYYVLEYRRAMFIPRYPRYIEYAQTIYKEEGAAIIEELLMHGRMSTVEVLSSSVDNMKRHLLSCAGTESNENQDEEGDDSGITKEEEMVLYEKIVSCMKDLVKKGFMELVRPIAVDKKATTSENGGRDDYVSDQDNSFHLSGKKRNIEDISGVDDDLSSDIKDETQSQHLQEVYAMLRSNQCRQVFPPGAVWRVNILIFHSLMRAEYLGRVVAERYSDKVKASGVIVTAALKFVSHKEFVLKHDASLSEEEKQRLSEDKNVFSPDDIMEYLPNTVLAALKNKSGGARSNLSAELVKISSFTHPQTILEVEDAKGHALGGKFEVTTRQLVSYLKHRISHDMVKDQYGEVAARICSILELQGNQESNTLAENAMVPAKDAQSILHKLYKANYISFLYLQQTKQHNPASAIYLWSIKREKMIKSIILNICLSIYNLRLRRQHEMQIGKDWIERAKESGITDENDSEMDRLNYAKFCQGLERIDNASLQLDNSLMVLNDFDF